MKKLIILITLLILLSVGFCQLSVVATPIAISSASAVSIDSSNVETVTVNTGNNVVRVNATRIQAVSSAIPITISTGAVSINDVSVVTNEEELVNEVSVAVATSAGNKNIRVVRANNALSVVEEDSGISATLVSTGNIVVQESRIYVNNVSSTNEINVLPSQALNAAQVRNDSSVNIELVSENEEVKYRIQETKQVRLFGLIPLNMSVSSDVNALTGTTNNILKPWWSILTIE